MKLIKKCDPRTVDALELGKDEYVDYLYGCFRFDNPLADGFKTERDALLIANPKKNSQNNCSRILKNSTSFG